MVKIDYIHSRPKKLIGCGAIFFNEKNELLIVKPNYQSGWLVPGGSVEALESPMECCIREIKEEIGIDAPDLRFLGIQYNRNASEEGEMYDSIQCTFYGGVLFDDQISKIVLQKEELDAYKFCSIEEALSLLRPRLSCRIRAALDALPKGIAVYTEQIEKQ